MFCLRLAKVSHLQRRWLLWVMKKSSPPEVIWHLVSDTVCSLVKVGSWYVYLHIAFKQALSLRIARLEGWHANSEKTPSLSRLTRAAWPSTLVEANPSSWSATLFTHFLDLKFLCLSFVIHVSLSHYRFFRFLFTSLVFFCVFHWDKCSMVSPYHKIIL